MTSDQTGKKNQAERAKRQAVANSTSGYCQEILLPQPAQRPRRKRKLKIGKSSHQTSFLPQDKQPDLPESDRPVLKRKMTTLRKEPMIAPRIKARIKTDQKIEAIESIARNYTTISPTKEKAGSKVRPCRKLPKYYTTYF